MSHKELMRHFNPCLNKSHNQNWMPSGRELLSKVVFKHLSQAATWFDSVTSIPSLNFTPLMTLAR